MQKHRAPVAVQFRPALLDLSLRPISAALMNAIWRDNPAYAVVYNLEEALGLHDTFGLLMQQVGVEQELVGSTEQMIVYSPEAGVTFLRFQG